METKRKMVERFARNIEMERERLGLSQAEMAKELCMSLSTYKNLINGMSERIDCYSAYRVMKVTGKLFYELCDETFPEFEIMKICRELSPAQKKFIKSIAEIERELNLTEDSDGIYIPLIIPTADMKDGMIWDSFQLEQLNVTEHQQKYQGMIDCAILITSDHLSPAYVKGDILLVQQIAPRDGDEGIFISKSTGRAYIRKLIRGTTGAEIIPINGTGKSFFVGLEDLPTYDDWIKFGIVIAKYRRSDIWQRRKNSHLAIGE